MKFFLYSYSFFSKLSSVTKKAQHLYTFFFCLLHSPKNNNRFAASLFFVTIQNKKRKIFFYRIWYGWYLRSITTINLLSLVFFVQFHISLTVRLKSLFLMFSFIHPNFLYTNKVELFYAVVWWLVLWSHFSYFHLLFGSLNDDWKEKKEVKHYLSWCWIFSFLLPYQMLILGFSGIIWNMAIYCLSICLFVYELKSVEIEMFTIFFFCSIYLFATLLKNK